MRRKTSSATHCARHGRTGEQQQLGNTREQQQLGSTGEEQQLGVEHLHDWVSDSWHALIKGLSDDCKAPRIGSHQGGKVCHQVDGGEVIRVCDLQSLQQRGQAVVAEPQRLACMSIIRCVMMRPACHSSDTSWYSLHDRLLRHTAESECLACVPFTKYVVMRHACHSSDTS
jgi:hypothetical protein